MRNTALTILSAASLLLMGITAEASRPYGNESDFTKYVDPFIGADNGGYTFPGACVPYGMVKLGPDCNNLTENAGWQVNTPVVGFSHTHINGSGGGCKYGNVLFMATTGDMDPDDYASPYSNAVAKVGLFSIDLDRYGISARLSATQHAGFHEYEFPETDKANVLVDLGKFLASYEIQEFVGSEVTVLSDTEIQGYTRIRGGWNYSEAYTVYFYAKFDTPCESFGTWKEGQLCPGIATQSDANTRCGAYFTFNTNGHRKIRAKVGISYMGYNKARETSEEICDWNIETTRLEAVSKWNDILSQVEVEGGDEDVKKVFYSSLYRIFLQPTDYKGENPKWISDEPYYGDYHAIWDTFRATHPMINLLRPTRGAEMVQSLVNIYEHDKYMPDARTSHWTGRTQGGSNSDMLVADAFVKGLTGIDYESALKGMIKGATVPPGDDERQYGRGGLPDYNSIGYVSTSFERGCSRTFEYASNDYAIATLAKGLGHMDIYEEYRQKANNWENLWNPDIESLGFKGFCWPRHADGSWLSDPAFTVFSSGSFPHQFYETFSWELSFYVPHDMKSLIKKMGGKEEFTRRLDTYFNAEFPRETRDQLLFYTKLVGMCQSSNEPCFLTPSLYAYVNQPYKTAEIVRRILREMYWAAGDGVPGNDDSGSMGAWYAFHTLGFYPNAGQDVYLISSPVFPKVTLRFENGKKLNIVANNASEKNIYVKSCKLNGKALNRCWLHHAELVDGGTLEFEMCSKPSAWASDGELPPSMSDIAY